MAIVQNIKPEEPVFKPGDKVMMQDTGKYQRLVPASGTYNQKK